jgi:Spy/CpxP family protein refolding chaperone
MRKILFFITVLWFTLPLTAQQPASNRQQGKQYIAQQISQYVSLFSLNEQQAQQFDALYKAYNKKMRAVHDLYQKEPVAEGTALTEDQVEQRILDNFAQSRAILDVREQYYKQFRQILTPSQINKIFEDEKARRAQIRNKNG